MKRVITLVILCLVLLAFLLGGCQSAPTSQENSQEDSGTGEIENGTGDFPETGGRPLVKQGTAGQ